MKRFLEENFPPGFIYKTELFTWLGVSCIWTANSMINFFAGYLSKRQELYIRKGTEFLADERKIMPDFIDVFDPGFLRTLLFALLLFIAASAVHYKYYSGGSKSIYLMLRLPNRTELHRRSLLIPLLFSILFILMSIILFFLYYAVYMNFTPKACLSPGQWQRIWRVFR